MGRKYGGCRAQTLHALIVLDSCVWIEVLQLTNTGKHYLPLWDDEENITVPAPVQFEMYRWCLRRLNEVGTSAALSAARRCKLLPLSEVIALRGAEVALEHGLAAVDALIYAATLEINATLVTCDAHFAGLPSVDYQPKLSS